MRLATIKTDKGTQACRIEGEEVVGLSFDDVGELLASGADSHERAAVPGTRFRLADVGLAPTVTNPSKIFCLGLNYRDHVEEASKAASGGEPEYPTFFAKFADSLTGPYDKIMLPKASNGVDWEVEMVVVIGSTVRNASEQQAVDTIAGYAVGNDISMRDWQMRTSEWLVGKTWEASTPIGPMVTADEVGGAGRPDLEISCELDGVLMQHSRTANLMFDAVVSIQQASTVVSLRPGDLIFTGTCAGVGFVRKPPVFIQPGQVVTTRIEGLGECMNEFYAE